MRRHLSIDGMSRMGVIKRIQQGVLTWGSAATGAVTLSHKVDPDNTLIFFNGMTNSGITQNDIGWARIELNAAGTTITGYRYYTGADTTSVGWCVVEYHRGILRRVQRSNVTYSASPHNITITAVDLTKAIVNHLGMRINDATGPTSYFQVSIQLTTEVNLQIQAGSIVSQDVGWQVGEFN